MHQKITAILVVALFAAATSALAQVGEFTGVVTDASGAVIPGAEVKFTSSATGFARTALSNDEGRYRISAVPVGSYDVHVEMTGFKTWIQRSVILEVDQIHRIDVRMELGDINESIEVSSQAVRVQTEEGRLSNVVSARKILDLPLNGRDISQLIEMQPGAVAVGSSNDASATAAAVNGNRNRSNNFMLDGVSNNDEFTGGRVTVSPPPDAVQEFSVVTNNFSAEFGRNAGAVINVVTKGGSNEFHGSVWEFHRNDALDARTVFDGAEPAPLIRHQFGATVGGPVIKEKLFFFFSYEGLREQRGLSQLVTVETPEFRDLVIRENPNSVAAFLYQNYPAAAAPNQNLQDIGQPFPTGDATQSTPDGIFDIGNVFTALSELSTSDQFSGRLDTEFNDGKDRLSGRYFLLDGEDSNRTQVPRPGSAFPVTTRGQNVSLNETHIFSPSVINEFRFGFNRKNRSFTTEADGVPQINMNDGTLGFGAWVSFPLTFIQNTFQWTDTLSINKGNHAIKTGYELRRIQDNSDFSVARGNYLFFTVLDFANDDPFFQFQPVDPRTNMISANIRGFRFWEMGAFVQDDWKVTPRFTLNLGLRWDFFGRPSEVQDRLANIILGEGNDIFERMVNARAGQVDSVLPTRYGNFGPRIGFAYDLTGKGQTVLRAGFGVTYDRLFNNPVTNVRFNPPFYSFAQAFPLLVPSQAGLPFIYGPQDGSPVRIDGANNNPGVGPDAPAFITGNIIGWNPDFGVAQQSLRIMDPAWDDAYVQSIFFGLQHRLFGDWIAEANYNGSLGRHLAGFVDYNTEVGDLLDGSLDRINQTGELGAMNFRSSGFSSAYHSGQFQLKKGFTNGYTLQAAYTVGKTLDQTSNLNGVGANLPVDPRNIGLDRGPAQFDVRQRLVINGIWDLPFFESRRGSWTYGVLGGWELTGILSLQSGRPFTVACTASFSAGCDYNANGTNNDRPNLPAFGLSQSTDRNDYINGLFNASDFPIPTLGTNGNLPRNAYRGPGFASIDMGVFKNFGMRFINEEAHLQFRAEFFNALNRVNLQDPNGALQQGTFARSTASFDARQIQFALKFVF